MPTDLFVNIQSNSKVQLLLLPFIGSPSPLCGVHCAQWVWAHVNVHVCQTGGVEVGVEEDHLLHHTVMLCLTVGPW